MVTLEDVKTSLLSNRELPSEIKEQLFELVTIFHERFKEILLDNLSNRLATLKFEKSNRFLNRDISMYDFRKNIIFLNAHEMKKEYDMRHVLMFELLNIVSSTEFQTGFNFDNKYEALNIGYTEILANFLVGNQGEVMLFPEEASLTNLIATVIGNDTLFDAYFKNDASIVARKVQEMGIAV